MNKKFDLQVLIDLVDRLSGPMKMPLQRMQQLEIQAQRTRLGLDRMLTGAKFMAAGAALALPLGKMVKDASDGEESLSKLRRVFGDHAAEVERWASRSVRAFGLNNQATLEYAGTLGNLFTAMRLDRGRAAEMSTELIQLAGDMASFHNSTIPEALDALRSGLRGATMPLRRYGINLSEAQIQQQALSLGLIRTAKEMTPAVRAQATYALIMAQSQNVLGDFAKTQDGLANSSRMLREALSDTTGILGEHLLPLATAGMRVMRELVLRFNEFARANPLLARMLMLSAGGLAVLLTLVGGGIVTLGVMTILLAQARKGLILMGFASSEAAAKQNVLQLALAGTIARLRTLYQRLVLAGAASVTSAAQFDLMETRLGRLRLALRAATVATWRFTVALLANPIFLKATLITAAVAGILAIGVAFVRAYRSSEEFRRRILASIRPLTTAWDRLRAQIASLGRLFAPLGDAIGRWTSGLANARRLFSDFLDRIAYGLGFIVGLTVGSFALVLAVVLDSFRRMLLAAEGGINILVGLFTGDLDRVRLGTQQVFDSLHPLVRGALGRMGRATEQAWQWIRRETSGAWLGIQGSIATFLSWASGVPASIQDWFTGLWDDLRDHTSVIMQWLEGRINTARMTLNGYWELIKEAPANVWDTLRRNTEEMLEWFSTLPQRFLDEATRIGSSIVEGIAEGIQSARRALGSAGDWIYSNTVGRFRQDIDARSPSRVFARLGAAIPQGIGLGIARDGAVAAQAMRRVTAAIMAAASLSAPATSVPAPAGVQPPIEVSTPSLVVPPPLERDRAARDDVPSLQRGEAATRGNTFNFPNATFVLPEFKTKDEFLEVIAMLMEEFGE
jgi:hypothetical protein